MNWSRLRLRAGKARRRTTRPAKSRKRMRRVSFELHLLQSDQKAASFRLCVLLVAFIYIYESQREGVRELKALKTSQSLWTIYNYSEKGGRRLLTGLRLRWPSPCALSRFASRFQIGSSRHLPSGYRVGRSFRFASRSSRLLDQLSPFNRKIGHRAPLLTVRLGF